MSQIVLDHVTKRYDGSVALDDVSLEIEDNVTTAVVGPSGSGKSTLLQLVNGLVRPSEGTVKVFGGDIDYGNLEALRRQFGYAVQGTGLFPHMTAWENITLLARLCGWPPERTRERAEHLMDLVGLPERISRRYPIEMSGGEQQRVGLCRAMMLDPRVFLLDEPFGALDPITRSDIHEEFVKIQSAEPRTIVIVTHDVREALRLADRLVILARGAVVQHATAREVVERPANAFVRDLIHSQLDDWGPRHQD